MIIYLYLCVYTQPMSLTVPAEFTMLSDLAGCYKFADLCQFLIASYNSKSYLISRWSSISSCWNWKSKSVTQRNFHMKQQNIPEWICHVSHEGSHFRPQGASGTPRGPKNFFSQILSKSNFASSKVQKNLFIMILRFGAPRGPRKLKLHMTKKMPYILYTGFLFVIVVHYSIKVADKFSPNLRSKKEVRRNVSYKRELRNLPWKIVHYLAFPISAAWNWASY